MKRLGSKKKALELAQHRPRTVRKLKYLGLALVLFLLIILISEWSLFADPSIIRNFILKFGWWAPLMVVLLQMFQSMVSIIPSQVTTVVAGFLFGPVLGAIYSLIGSFAGSLIIFLISRKYGKRLALKFFNLGDILHFEAFFKQKKLYALFLARVAPIFPNDLVSFTAGLTSISIGWFNLISTLGLVVQVIILVIFGSQLAEGQFNFKLLAISIMVGLLFLVLLFKKQIHRMIIKDIHEIEKDLKQGVKVLF